ncbi:MAG TPA: NAD(P)H-dependent oxidoreductase [Candidatus Paceibacterota bacterium]|jgi:multimeric flavodoxin WrbA|nr:NAD(P)H-dependent oxidoreductase [Candidatus Paceibacterota bacterium]
MKAVILLGTLKKEEKSNTEILSKFLARRMKSKKINSEIVKLVDYNVLPGTYSDMGESDEWPKVLKKILDSNIIIFATPIWWGGHSSETQRVIERLDEIHDEILKGKKSRLEGKIGGIVITGDSDGAQHIIGNISNFFNALGIVFPPYATLSVLWEGQKKEAKTSQKELLKKYQKEYLQTADTMIKELKKFV